MEDKRRVSVGITNHIKKFINFKGDEISREQALGLKPKINIGEPKVDTDENKTEEGDGGEGEKEEVK